MSRPQKHACAERDPQIPEGTRLAKQRRTNLMTPIQSAWEALSNSMRLYAESSLKFKQLFDVDAEEAVANHDRAFEAKLEAFHRLYDLTKGLSGFEYFKHADTALLVHLRNAIHHRDHALFISWNSMLHGEGGIGTKASAAYLLASYEGMTSLASKFFLPLHDFYKRLGHSSVKKPDVLRAMWDADLSFAAISQAGISQQFPDGQVYVDVMPIFISAIQRATLWLANSGVETVGFDGKTYAEYFKRIDPVDLSKLKLSTLRIPLTFASPPSDKLP